MKKALSLLLAVALLAGCDAVVPDKITSKSKKVYEVTRIDPPKDFIVDIRDVETGKVYTNLYVSMYCEDWKKLQIGSRWTFTEIVYDNGKAQYTKIDGIEHEFCYAIRNLKP